MKKLPTKAQVAKAERQHKKLKNAVTNFVVTPHTELDFMKLKRKKLKAKDLWQSLVARLPRSEQQAV